MVTQHTNYTRVCYNGLGGRPIRSAVGSEKSIAVGERLTEGQRDAYVGAAGWIMRPGTPEPYPEEVVAVLQAHRPLLSLKDHQLLSEGQVLERQAPPTPQPRYEGPYRNPDPIPPHHPLSPSRQEPSNLGAYEVFATHTPATSFSGLMCVSETIPYRSLLLDRTDDVLRCRCERTELSVSVTTMPGVGFEPTQGIKP